MKVAEEKTQEQPKNEVGVPKKQNRHVTVALNHLKKR